MSSKCLTPFYVKKHKILSKDKIPVPCGKCPNCLKRRVSAWSFRLTKEGEISSPSFFLTLTYNTDNVPITQKGFMNLKKRDLQLFFKRLRKHYGKEGRIKYYAVGEYGGTTMRPHYHIILYNASSIEVISRAWQLGYIHYGKITAASIGYTLKYVSKPSKVPVHKNDDRQKEFSLMSKGLGKNYITENMVKWHKLDLENRMYIPLKDGKKIAMPRYYKDKIYSENEREIIKRNLIRVSELAETKERDKLGKDYDFVKMNIAINKFNNLLKNRQMEKI